MHHVDHLMFFVYSLIYIYFCYTILVPPLCADLIAAGTLNSECQTCDDVNGAGTPTTVESGESCLQTSTSMCKDGVCIGKGFSDLFLKSREEDS